MKKLIVAGLLTIVGFGANAQDQKAKDILDQLTAKTKAYKTIYAQFEYTLSNKAEGIKETQTGTLMTKGDMYHLIIDNQEIICDGKTIWTYLKDAGEVQVNNVPEDSDDSEVINPNTIFTMYEKGFKYKYVKQLKKGNVTYELINIYPENPGAKSYHTVRLSIIKGELRINKIMIKGKDGTNYVYKITAFEPNKEIADTEFKFDANTHPDVEVIDLRE